jgi:hypothetical protein
MMLRMAHRIITQGVNSVPAFRELASTIKARIPSAHLLIADNCAQIMFDQELEQDRFMNPYELPCIKPPFAEMFIEFQVPESYKALAAREASNAHN